MNLSIKRIFLFFILSFVSISYSQANKDNISLEFNTEIQEIVGEKIIKNASFSFYAINLNTNEVIRSINPDLSLIPASSLKLLTTATGLEILGSDFKFQTKIQHDGEIDAEGTLQGNIYIQGGGDPSLGSKMFNKHYYEPHFIKVWVNAIKQKGIKKIKGAVIGDPYLYGDYEVPGTWVTADLGYDYGAGFSGLSIFDNIYTVFFNNEKKDKGRPTILHISPHLPEEVEIINDLRQSRDSCNIFVSGLPYQNTRIIKGTVTPRDLKFVVKGSIPDPAYWAAYSLNKELEKQGIKVDQKPTTTRRQRTNFLQQYKLKEQLIHNKQVENNIKGESLVTDIYITDSPPLKGIVGITNRESNNLYAEHILNQIGLVVMGKGNTKNGIEALMDFWYKTGINTLGMFLHDGSGLSRYNSITTKQLVEILCYMKNSKNYDAFYHSFPIAGETGTLKELFMKAPLKGNLKAKTGGMQRVLSYTGYCTNVRGEEIAFSLIINNYNTPPREVKKEIEKIFTRLVNEG
jgi:D-alanyl-D-alanine carboxypeptidase/D-alanyl-D-alanine-endopeptidase (penicillin-binding protein 4)